MRGNNPGTFVGNGEYHNEEGVEMNFLGPKTGSESDWRMVFEHHSKAALSRAAHYC